MRLKATSIVEITIAIALCTICLIGANRMAIHLLKESNIQVQNHLQICTSTALFQLTHLDKKVRNSFIQFTPGCYLRQETIPLPDVNGLVLYRVTATPSPELNTPKIVGTSLGQMLIE